MLERHTGDNLALLLGFLTLPARAFGVMLVTDNVREFARVSGFSVENWLSFEF